MSNPTNNVSISAGGSVTIGTNAVLGINQVAAKTLEPDAAANQKAASASVDRFDIFISYSRPDRLSVDRLASLLSQAGYTVWYDRELTPGNNYQREISERLETARAVLVVWSRTAVQSEWVLSEAEVGRRRGILVAVAVEPVVLPPPHSLTHFVQMELDGAEPLPQPVWQRLAQLKS